jgi:Tuberculosis necrotizing toxin
VVPLVVDPQALFASGSAVVAAGGGLSANLTVLTTGFSAHTGLDAAGMVFGLAYQEAAEKLLTAAAAAVNACLHSGAVIQQGAANYSKAEAASTLGGGADVLQAPPEPAKITAPGPPGTWGKGEPPPVLWALVQSFLDDVWPDGDVAGLRAAAGRWRSFGAALGGMQGTLNASKSLFDGQHLPEGGKIDEALSQIGDSTAKAADLCGTLAQSLDNFANEVEKAQNAIRDLLNRLGSLADLGHDVMLIIEGDAIDEIKRIAVDIEAVLHNLGREARAMEQGIKAGMQIVDGLVVKFEKYVRGQLTKFLGDEVGNPIATVFDTWLNANEGVLKGAVNTALALNDLDPRWFAIDPNGAAATWEGMGKSLWKGSLINGFLNPQEAGQANLQTLKGLLHLDDWSTARPGLGAGENIFDVATLFIPGAGEAGAAADGAGAAARGAEAAADAERAAGRVADGFAGAAGVRTGLADAAKTSGDLTRKLEGVSGDLPKIEAPVGGTPVALPAPKQIAPPVESVPRPPEAPPGTSTPGPTEGPGPAPPEPSGPAGDGPHGPEPGPAGGPGGPASGPPPAPAPAGGAHEPPPEPSNAVHAPASAGSPHDPLAPPAGAPHEPAPSPGGNPHEPVPATAPRSAPLAVSGGAPHDPVSVPVGNPHEPSPAPTGASLASMPAAAGERLPSTVPQLAEHSPPRVSAAPGGSPGEPAPLAAHSAQPAPSFTASTPHSGPAGGRPTELPGGGGSHGRGDGGGPHCRGDGDPPDGKGGLPPGGFGRRGSGSGGAAGDGKGDLPPDGDGSSGAGDGGPSGDGERQDPVHSHEPSGDGWHRLADEPIDPHYGEPLSEHWDFTHNPADTSHIQPSVAKLIEDPEAPFGRDPQGNAYTERQYAERFNKLGPAGEHWMSFPGNAGAVPGTRVVFTDAEQFANFYGRHVDRVGMESGKYLAVMEDGVPASWEARALHVNSLSDPYSSYVLRDLPDGWQIEVSEVAPGLGQRGGSIQVRIFNSEGKEMTVEELTDPDIGVLE